MVLAYKKKQQKNRSFLGFNNFKLRFGTSAVIALSSGFLSFKTIKNFYIIFKKMFKFSRSITKFWIYLNVYYIITKKPLNVRMGKGKGSRKGRLSLVKSGNSLVELRYCRFGLFFKLYKYISTRCSFNTNYFFLKSKGISRFNINTNNYCIKYKRLKKIKNKLYISNRFDEVLSVYGRSSDMKRYRKTMNFFNKFYQQPIYYMISEGRRSFKYSHRYLKHYFKKKKRYNLLYSKLYKYSNIFWIKLQKRKKRKKKRLSKSYRWYKIYKNKINFFKNSIKFSVKNYNNDVLSIKKKIKKIKLKKILNIKKIKLNISYVEDTKKYRSISIKKFRRLRRNYIKKIKTLRKIRMCWWFFFKLKYNKIPFIKKKKIEKILIKNYNF